MEQDAAARDFGRDEALCDFLAQWHEDRALGLDHGLLHYLARFPDAPEAVAAEFLRLESGDPPGGVPTAPPSGLRDGPDDGPRYERRGELARGGMGLIECVRDLRLGRDLARKSALRRGVNAALRLEKEARLTGQLDHPGIVPVHDFGIDPDGVPWFTMRLISGRDLREIIQLVHSDDPEWTLAAVLSVLLRVCETVAFAHSRGVVHRDLKPSNVRVGRFGEVYVLDWGLARPVLEQGVSDQSRSRFEAADDSTADLLLTMDGDVVGTPGTMSPEQAAGRLAEVGPRSDVYSVGAMLYELLAGQVPYAEPGEFTPSKRILERVLSSPPTPLAVSAPEAPPELVAICEKAMARDPADRYGDMREMAADVRAYVEGRVVRAYRTGVRAELGKWVARNRGLAVAAGAGLLATFAALALVAHSAAETSARLRLRADTRAPADLMTRAKALSTGHPEDAARQSAWLSEARELLARLPAYEREFAALKARALPWDPDAARERAAADARSARIAGFDQLIDYYEVELAAMRSTGRLSEEGLSEAAVVARQGTLRRDRAALANAPVERLDYAFAHPSDAERFAEIGRLLADAAPLLDGPDRVGLVRLTEQRHAYATTVRARTLVEQEARWERALESIADRAACPAYGGLELQPQLGLVPLRQDPDSGLWEFVHIGSGEAPRDLTPEGPLQIDEDTGIVLVLLPGGKTTIGAQSVDPGAPRYDPNAQPLESRATAEGPAPILAILSPFFVGKYEVTQAQWRRLVGAEPSEYGAQSAGFGLHPVENVNWRAALEGLSAVGLTLPSEAQWEYAARGGTDDPWWTGRDALTLLGAANVADRRFIEERHCDATLGERFDDGAAIHAPVGRYAANPFGLFDVAGNVSEWCLDRGMIGYERPEEVLMHTSERRLFGEGLRVRRGGSFEQLAIFARSAARSISGPEFRARDAGFRAARPVDTH